ncbi:hypothetical protein ABPG72_005507 [Tetrahymena utriculariae]
MFESILERILNNYFGRFITGLDQNNLHLGVWKGDIKIENVSIRSDLMDSLEYPLKIKYSNIGSLIIKVPWTKLSSMPVQIILQDIFILVEPIDEKNWNFQDDKAINRKLMIIQNYLQMCIEKFLMKQEQNSLMQAKNSEGGSSSDQENNQSYLGKLTKRIIDNLELTIQRIHFRWEDKIQQYSWGISLEEISVFTCDGEWKKKFLDGTQTQDQLIRKLGEIKNLSLYWNDQETEFLTRDQQNINQKMVQYVQQDNENKHEILNLSINVKVSQKINSSEIICQVEQQKLEFILKVQQVLQITKLLEKMQVYKKLLWMAQNDQKKPEEDNLTEQELNDYKLSFLEVMEQIKQQEGLQNSSFDVKKTQMPIILRKVKYETLFEWSRECAKKRIKEKTIDQEQEKKNKQKWFFQNKNETLSKQEQEEIERKIEIEFAKENDFLDSPEKGKNQGNFNDGSNKNKSNLTKKQLMNLTKKKKKINLIVDFNLHILSIVLQESAAQNLQLDVNKIHFYMVRNGDEKQNIEFTVRNIILFQGIKNQNENEKRLISNNIDLQKEILYKNIGLDSPFITSPQTLQFHSQSRKAYKKVNKYVYCPKNEENFKDFESEEQGYLDDFKGRNKRANQADEEYKYQEDQDFSEFSSQISENEGKNKRDRSKQPANQSNPFLSITLEKTILTASFVQKAEDQQKINQKVSSANTGASGEQTAQLQQSVSNHEEDDYIKFKSYLKCRVQPLVVFYDKDFIDRTKKFFEIKNQDEFLKSATWQKIEQIQDETTNRFSRAIKQQSKNEWILDIEIFRQKVRIPVDTSESLWELKIPKISIKNINTNSICKIQHNAFFENVSLCLKETNICTYLLRDYTMQAEIIQNKQQIPQQQNRYSTTRIKQPEEIPLFKTTLLLPSLSLELTEAFCKKILLIPQAFRLKKNKKQEKREKLKEKLLSNCTHKGFLQCKENYEWNKYFVVFAGAYLYFFSDDSISSSDILKQIYIKNSLIHNCLTNGGNSPLKKNSNNQGFQLHPYTLSIKNRYDQCELACRQKKELIDWTTKLIQKVEEYATIEELIKLKEKEEEIEDSNNRKEEQDNSIGYKQDKNKENFTDASQKSTSEIRSNNQINLSSQISISMDKFNLKVIKYKLCGSSSDQGRISIHQASQKVMNSPDKNKSEEGEEQNEQDYYIDLQLYKLKIENKSYQTEYQLSIQFKQLILLDGVFKFTNERFQPLIQTEKNTFSEILIITRKNNKKINVPNKEIIVTMQKALVNWKPDTILKIREWVKLMKGLPIKTIFKQEEEMTIEQMLQEALNRNQEREQAFSKSFQTVKDKQQLFINYSQAQEAGRCSQLLFDLGIQIEQLEVNLIHRTSHMGIYNARVQNADVMFKRTAEAKYLDGTLKEFTIYDITNYPKTIDSNLYFDQIKPTPLLGRKIGAENSKKNNGRFRFASYQDQNIYNKERVNSFLQLDLNEVYAVYQQQPIMRMINYIVNYFCWIFIQPEFLTMNDDYFAQKIVQPDLKPKSVWGSKIEMLQKILFATFMDIRVYLYDSFVQIKPFPQFSEFFQLDTKLVEVYNSPFLSNRRYKKLIVPKGADRLFNLLEEDWIIHVHPMTIQHVKDYCIYQNISTLTRYNMQWNRMCFYPNLNYLYPELDDSVIDSGFWIRSELHPLTLKLFRNEYIHIIRMIIHNFTQNDFKDVWFNHSQNVQQLFPPAEMNFYIDFPNVSVFAMSRVDDIPHIKLVINRLRLKWLKDHKNNIIIALYGEKINISYYDKVDSQNLLEKKLMGEDILKVQKVQLSGKSSDIFQIDHSFVIDRQYTPLHLSQMSTYGFEDKEFNEKRAQFTFYENMFSGSGDKDMLLKFQDVKVYVKPSVIMNVAFWSMMQQDCWPKKDVWDDLNRIIFMTNLINCQLILPSDQSDLVLYSRGEVSYLFMRQKMKQQEDFRERFIKGQVDNEYLNDLGDVYTFSVTLKDFELYRCNIQDLNRLKFDQIPRRSILMPANIFWHMNKYIQIADTPYYPVFFNVRHDINFDKTIIKFSYKDIYLIKRVIDFWKKDLINQKKDPDWVKMKQEEEETFKQDPKNSQETPSQQTIFDVVLHGAKVFIINDGEGSSVPVLELTLNETQMVYNISKVKSIMSAILKFSLGFYNPSTSKWEAIIERAALDFDISFNKYSNPRKQIIIELNPEYEEININISKELIKIIKHTIMSWKREIQLLEIDEKAYQQSIKNQNLIYMEQIFEECEEMEENNAIQSNISSQTNQNMNNNSGNNQTQSNSSEGNQSYQPSSSQLKSQQMYKQSSQIRNNSGNNHQNQYHPQSPEKMSIFQRDQFNLSSDQRIESLALSRETSTKFVESAEKESLEYVSPYTIRNELGYAISIKSDYDPNKPNRVTYGTQVINYHPGYTIPTWTEMNYQIDSDIYSNFFNNTDLREKRTITLTLKHPYLEFDAINGIDLDSVQKTMHQLQSKIDKTFQVTQLIIEVIPQATRKMIILRSSLTFINKLDEALEIQLMHPSILQSFVNERESQIDSGEHVDSNINSEANIEEYPSTFFLLGPNQRLCIPFDKINYILLFRFSNQLCQTLKQIEGQDLTNKSKWSQKLNLSKVAEIDQEIVSYPLKHSNDKISMIKFIKKIEGECIIQAEPSIIVKNCLPLSMKYKLYFESQINDSIDVKTFDGTLHIQQEIQSHYVSLEHRVFMKIQLPGYQWSKKALLYSTEINENQVEKIEVFDYQQYSTYLEIQKCENTFGSKKYFIYTPQFVINETPYDIFYFSKQKNRMQIISGQRITQVQQQFQDAEQNNQPSAKICLLSNLQNLIISLNENGDHQSQPIDLQTFGQNTIDLCVPQVEEPTSLYQFGMNVSLICADSVQQIYIKSVIVSPKYIVVNKTNYSMSVCQSTEEKSVTVVEAESRLPFFWTNFNKDKHLRIRVQEPDEGTWGWSGSIDVNDSQSNMISFCLRNQRNDKHTKFMKLDVRQDEHLVYLVLHECKNEEEAVYIIENKLDDIEIEVSQRDQLQYFAINPHTSQQFAWEQPIQHKHVQVNLKFKGKYLDQYEVEPLILDLEDNDSEREYKICSLKNEVEDLIFYGMICIEGSTKKVKFYFEHEIHERNKLEDNLDIQVGAKLKNFNISLISWNKQKRQEIALCHLKNIDFVMLQTQSERTCQLKIGFIQIDNNISYSASFPVVFTPTAFEKMQKLNRPHFSLILVQNIMVKNIKIIKSVKCQLQQSTLKLTDNFLDCIINFIQECNAPLQAIQKQQDTFQNNDKIASNRVVNMKNLFNKGNRVSSTQSMFGDNSGYIDNLQEFSFQNDMLRSNSNIQFEWQYSKLPNIQAITLINEIEIYPIDLDLSFKANTKEDSADQSFFVLNIFKAIGLAFKNIDNASVNLKRTKLHNVLDTTSGAIKRLVKSYYLAVISIFLNMIGSLNLFANPLGFVKSLYIGFTDLISYPIEGFIKGPVEGTISIFKGVGSLAKNSISGSFNSVQSLTEPLSTVCSTLSLDDVYIEKRAYLNSLHPRHAIEGIGIGLLAMGNGIQRGVVGIVDIPYTEAKKSGVVGFFKGSMKGLSGVLFKPICGGIDFVSKTAEGIKNTVTFFDDKPSNKRIRNIRPFYGIDQYYKEYDAVDANIVYKFNKDQKSKYKDDIFIGTFILLDFEQAKQIAESQSVGEQNNNAQNEFEQNGNEKLLVLTLHYIILTRYKDNKLIWDVDINNITQINSSDLSIKIMHKLQSNKIQIYEIICHKKELTELILDKINYAKENISKLKENKSKLKENK